MHQASSTKQQTNQTFDVADQTQALQTSIVERQTSIVERRGFENRSELIYNNFYIERLGSNASNTWALMPVHVEHVSIHILLFCFCNCFLQVTHPSLSNGGLECMICMQTMLITDRRWAFQCAHAFHEVCISNWLTMSGLTEVNGCPFKCAASFSPPTITIPHLMAHTPARQVGQSAASIAQFSVPPGGQFAAPAAQLPVQPHIAAPIAQLPAQPVVQSAAPTAQVQSAAPAVKAKGRAKSKASALTAEQLERVRERRFEALNRRRTRLSVNESDMDPSHLARLLQQQSQNIATQPGGQLVAPMAQLPMQPQIAAPIAQAPLQPGGQFPAPMAQPPVLPGGQLAALLAQPPLLPGGQFATPMAQPPVLPGGQLAALMAQPPLPPGGQFAAPAAQLPVQPGGLVAAQPTTGPDEMSSDEGGEANDDGNEDSHNQLHVIDMFFCEHVVYPI